MYHILLQSFDWVRSIVATGIFVSRSLITRDLE